MFILENMFADVWQQPANHGSAGGHVTHYLDRMATSRKKDMKQEKDSTFEEIRTLIEEWEKHHCLYNTTV